MKKSNINESSAELSFHNRSFRVKYYLVKDTVSKRFGNLFSAVNDEMAVRQFEYGLKDYPFRQDTQLYFLGSLDEETGEFNQDLKFLQSYEEIKSNEE